MDYKKQIEVLWQEIIELLPERPTYANEFIVELRRMYYGDEEIVEDLKILKSTIEDEFMQENLSEHLDILLTLRKMISVYPAVPGLRDKGLKSD